MQEPTNTDAGRGTTRPERGEEEANLVGRPWEEAPDGFKAPENRALERETLDVREELERGGSFDQEGVPPQASGSRSDRP